MGEFCGLGIDSPDAREEWRLQQAMDQSGNGDVDRYAFDASHGVYVLRSHDLRCRDLASAAVVVPGVEWPAENIQFRACSPLGGAGRALVPFLLGSVSLRALSFVAERVLQ